MQQLRHVSILILLLMIQGFTCFAQEKEVRTEEKVPFNQVDARGKKHGMWWTSQPASMGEPGTTEFGSYDHGEKLGPWYKMDVNGDLISIESYKRNVLDGEAKYFDRGQLYCTGNYRGLNPAHDFDTIVVMDPITQDESYKVISTERGYMRHGTWRYFNPATGRLIKEEEYQVDELVYKKEMEAYTKADSLAIKQRELAMPHNKKSRSTPAAPKKYQYISNY